MQIIKTTPPVDTQDLVLVKFDLDLLPNREHPPYGHCEYSVFDKDSCASFIRTLRRRKDRRMTLRIGVEDSMEVSCLDYLNACTFSDIPKESAGYVIRHIDMSTPNVPYFVWNEI